MTYPPQPDPHGAQPGPHSGGWQPGQTPQQGYQYPQQGSDAFWRQVAGGQQQRFPQPPKKSRTGLIVGLVVGGALLLVGGGIAVAFALTAGSQVEAGDCMALRDERGGAMSGADCGSPESDYEVVEVKDDRHAECGDDYVNYTGNKAYCIVLDVKVGDCLTAFQDDEEVLPLKIECSRSEDQVTRIAGGQDPETACGKNEGYYVFSRKTVCFGDVRGI